MEYESTLYFARVIQVYAKDAPTISQRLTTFKKWFVLYSYTRTMRETKLKTDLTDPIYVFSDEKYTVQRSFFLLLYLYIVMGKKTTGSAKLIITHLVSSFLIGTSLQHQQKKTLVKFRVACVVVQLVIK